MLNACSFIGNLGRDPEVRHTQANKKIVHLSLGVTEKWKDRQSGERKEATEWVRVVVFNENIADVAEKYLTKGARCYVSGQMKTRKWTDQSGVEKYTTEIVIGPFKGELVLLGGGEQRDGGGYADRDRSQRGAGAALDDDIPF